MDIVDQIRADRENGAICLEREYKSRLMAVAVNLCRDKTEAEALVYQAFDEAVRRIETLSHPESFYSWLCSILVNCHGMATRRKENSRISFTDNLPEPPEEDGMDNIVRTVDGAILHEAIDRLPPKLKETVVLRYFMDMPLQQIARFLMIPVGTVNSRLHVARTVLAMRLGAKLKKPAVALVAAGLFLLSSAAVIGLRHAGALGGADEPVQEAADQGTTENVLEAIPDASAVAPDPSDDANFVPLQQENTAKENTAMKTTTIGGLFRRAMRGLSAIAMTMLAANATYGDDPYIEGDGTSGISTGYRMKGTSRLEVDFALTEQTEQVRIFGDDAEHEASLKTILYVSSGASYFSMTTGNGTSAITRNKAGTDTGRHTAVIDLLNDKVQFFTGDTAVLDMTTGVSDGFSGTEANMPLPLFGRWGNDYASKFANCAKVRIYGVKIYEGDELVRDFVPCLKDGVACFRDLVNGGFIVGENAAAFTAGGDVPRYADDGYVSTAANADGGKLYINTGYAMTQKTAVELDCAFAEAFTATSFWGLFESCRSSYRYGFTQTHNYGLRWSSNGTWHDDFTEAFPKTLSGKNVRRKYLLDFNGSSAAVVTSGFTNRTVSFSTQSFTTAGTIKLSSGGWGNGEYAPLKIYGCKIWESGVLVRDFIPYVDNGIPGLRDRLTGGFVSGSDYSGGGNQLACGGTIVEDAYLESTGSVGINTGVKLNGRSRFEVDFSLTVTNANTKNWRVFGTDTRESNLKTWLGYDTAFNTKMEMAGSSRYPAKADTLRHIAGMNMANGSFLFVTGTTTNALASVTADLTGLEASMPLPLFGRYSNAEGTAYHDYTVPKARIYSVRIWEADSLTHEFLPYSRDGVVGFYDTVTGDIISNGSSFTFGGRGQDHGQLKVYIKPGYNDKIGYSESTTLTAYAPGATSYRWLCDGKPVEGGEDGVLTVAWTRGGVAQVSGFKVHTYQAVAVFEDFFGVARESAASAMAEVKCRQLGTTFIIK